MTEKQTLEHMETTNSNKTSTSPLKMSTRSSGRRGVELQPLGTPAAKTRPSVNCNGCNWSGKSLRGHLRAKVACKKFYDIDSLERDAKHLQKQQRAEWESANREKRTNRMKAKQVSPILETQQKACKGCKWNGKSLRGHLRENSQCQKFYDLDELEREAKEIKKLQRAKWEKVNRRGKRESRKRGKVIIDSPKQGTNDCNICNRTFTIKSNLVRHIKDVHDKSRLKACNVCSRKFSRRRTCRGIMAVMNADLE